jgi:hypothetical protein
MAKKSQYARDHAPMFTGRRRKALDLYIANQQAVEYIKKHFPELLGILSCKL